MKKYIAEYIVPVEKKGNDNMFDFMNAKPLIRCKDCKYWSAETEQTSMPNMRRCTWWRNIGTFPIDFCSRAERREHAKRKS